MMRAVLLPSDSYLATMLSTALAETGISLNRVATVTDMLLADQVADVGDFLIIDLSHDFPDEIDRCYQILGASTIPVHIVHPREDFVESLRATTQSLLYWLHPNVGILTLRDKTLQLKRGSSQSAPTGPQVHLTEREREVLLLVAKGYRYPQIAEALHVSVSTVKSHARNTKNKLGLGVRDDLARSARSIIRG